VKRAALLLLLVLIGCVAGLPEASGAAAPPCGLPASSPLWIDYADYNAPFWKQVFAKPGLVLATPPGDGTLAATLRAAGASTVYFDLHLNAEVGTPDAPSDPSTVAPTANKEFEAAVKSTGCPTPLIAENELFGATTQTPWAPSNVIYRADVLALLTELTALGAHPYLLISTPPYGADVANWWQQVAQVADIVREFYPAPANDYASGPITGSRTLREEMRAAIGEFTAFGIPPSRLGLMLEFESGACCRNGLQPTSAWYEEVKLQALAARQVAGELGLPTVWSWGWATYGKPLPADADKPTAACVYLWTRNQDACNGPAAAGKNFDTSLSEGQLRLQTGVFCSLGSAGKIANSTRHSLAAVTGDPETAAEIATTWAAAHTTTTATDAQINTAEAAVIANSFRGSQAAYLTALARQHATRALARDEIAAELSGQAFQGRLAAPPVTGAQTSAFATTYAAAQARLVTTKTPVAWLGGRTHGFAIGGFAPRRVFSVPTDSRATLQTSSGTLSIRPLEDTLPLAAVPPSAARASIASALVSLAKSDAYQAWLQAQEEKVLSSAICAGDDVPAAAPLDLTDYLPYLALP
jgi:hypothetical protein